MEHWASKEDTIAFLESLGFTEVETDDGQLWLDSAKHNDFDLPMVQLRVYQCVRDYWCVEAEGGYHAPVVWKGSRAEWDRSDVGQEFVDFLNQHFPGWR